MIDRDRSRNIALIEYPLLAVKICPGQGLEQKVVKVGMPLAESF